MIVRGHMNWKQNSKQRIRDTRSSSSLCIAFMKQLNNASLKICDSIIQTLQHCRGLYAFTRWCGVPARRDAASGVHHERRRNNLHGDLGIHQKHSLELWTGNTHKHLKCDWAEYICVCQPSGGWCELSQQCGRDSQALAGSENLSVGWRKDLDEMCQNVTRPHKQRLTHSQLAGRAERMTNRQTVGVTDAHIQWGK